MVGEEYMAGRRGSMWTLPDKLKMKTGSQCVREAAPVGGSERTLTAVGR